VKKKNETEEEFVEEEDEDEDELPEKCAREDPTPRLQEKQLDGPSSRSQQTKSLNSQELVFENGITQPSFLSLQKLKPYLSD
jgi:hypothetical protein